MSNKDYTAQAENIIGKTVEDVAKDMLEIGGDITR